MNSRYVKNEVGTGYFVWAGACFSDNMFAAQKAALDDMNHSVRQFLTNFVVTDKAKARGDTEIERINFLLERMKGEMKVKGGIGVRDLLEGYVLLTDTDAIIHRALYDG